MYNRLSYKFFFFEKSLVLFIPSWIPLLFCPLTLSQFNPSCSSIRSPEWAVSVTSPPSKALGSLQKREQKDCQSQRQQVTIRKDCLLDTAGQVHI